jgi:hypothetical protein
MGQGTGAAVATRDINDRKYQPLGVVQFAGGSDGALAAW